MCKCFGLQSTYTCKSVHCCCTLRTVVSMDICIRKSGISALAMSVGLAVCGGDLVGSNVVWLEFVPVLIVGSGWLVSGKGSPLSLESLSSVLLLSVTLSMLSSVFVPWIGVLLEEDVTPDFWRYSR